MITAVQLLHETMDSSIADVLDRVLEGNSAMLSLPRDREAEPALTPSSYAHAD